MSIFPSRLASPPYVYMTSVFEPVTVWPAQTVVSPGLTRFLLERFSSAGGSSFLDVGANLGYFSCLLGKLAGPRGKVVAIEPEPNNFKLLQRNLRNNGLKNVTVHECAVGAQDGAAKMGIYKAANRGRHSLVDLEGCKQFIEVPVRRLDDLVKDAGVESWDLVKMDVEGYEAFVFEGAKETLARAKMLGDGVRADSLEESRD